MELPFIQKYQPFYLKDFEIESELLELISTFINIDNLNILFVADSGTGKSSIITSIVREYYGENYHEENILYINSLKEQDISDAQIATAAVKFMGGANQTGAAFSSGSSINYKKIAIIVGVAIVATVTVMMILELRKIKKGVYNGTNGTNGDDGLNGWRE